MLRYFTSGESHGEALVAFLSGLPAGLAVDQAFVDRELWRRQQGYGRGGRMKIETDRAHFLSGVHHGKTIGSPIAVLLQNRDWQNWKESLPVETGRSGKTQARGIAAAGARRPGRSSEVRFHGSALCSGARVGARVGRAGGDRRARQAVSARIGRRGFESRDRGRLGFDCGSRNWHGSKSSRWPRKDEVLLSCADSEAEQRMKEEVDNVLRTGDSVGGVFEVVARNVPPGLGSYVQWDERLDALLAAAVMSLQAVKAVEIGSGIQAAHSPGSAVHDEIGYRRDTGFSGFTRTRNNAGGIEGGVSNGQEIRVRGYLKPISTLRRPLQSVDFTTREPVKAAYERSDVCVVPAAGVAGEAMVALTLARCALEKFGGDSLKETKRNFHGYLEQLKHY